jgi:hypothetical protein
VDAARSVQPVIRMASVLTALTACVTCALAVGAIHANECQPLVVNVHLQVDRSIRSRVIPADLKNETEVLWRPYGVHLEWTDSPASGAVPGGLFLEVILERRIIDAPGLPKWATVMGLTTVKANVPSARPIRVSLDATESVLASSRTSIGRMVYDHDLGRALGRVLAHEIGHSLLGAPHDDVGLMRAVFHPNELAEPDRTPFRLAGNGVARLRGRIGLLTGTEHESIDPETCLHGRAVRGWSDPRSPFVRRSFEGS